MAKKDVIKEILKMTDMFTLSELEGKKVEELEKILKLGQINVAKSDIKSADGPSIDVPVTQNKFSRMKKPTLDKNELIPVMNITNGTLVYTSRKTGLSVKFEKYGDVEYLEIGELLTMRSGQKRYLDEPWILIMDDEVVQYLGLDKMYKKLVSPQNVDQIFSFDLETYKEVVENAPIGYAQLIISRAKERLKDGSLDSMAKIKVLEEKFKVELVV
jgi:hypothetical protein